jgi:hypothetical protein
MINKLQKITISLLSMIALAAIYSCNTSAVAVSGFDAGNIIDDVVFSNYSSMNVSQIQAFLDSKVPNCDTWHTGFYGASGTWYGPPFTCLRNYSENGKTSAQIIYDASQTYKINPQVLIVLLQKEQSLITDTWPASFQYKSATGYGCPDDAPCATEYYGFTNQVSWSARMFRAILNDSPTWYTPYELGNNYIQYSPDGGCGGTTVNIQNRATQALYNYTPYQPNDAALAAGYGNGNYCSAYGNRNFYLYFTDWFGSTKAINGSIQLDSSLSISSSSTIYVGDKITASYTVKNESSFPISAGGFGVCARLNGKNYDFGFSNNETIQANSSINISYSKTISEPGNLDIFICSFNEQLGGWVGNIYPYNIDGYIRNNSFAVKDNPLITSGVTISPANPVSGQPVTASMEITNASSSSITIETLVIAARDPNGKNVDFPADTNVTIPANSTYKYSKTKTFTDSGNYSFFTSSIKDGSWNNSYPKSSSSSIVRSGSLIVQNTLLVTSGVLLSSSNPSAGEAVTATMDVRNFSDKSITVETLIIAARDPNGKNVDFPADTNVTIPANSTYKYSKTKTFSAPGNYTFFISGIKNGYWNNSYPESDINSSITRSGSFVIKDNPLISSGITLTPASPVLGQPVTASMEVVNSSNNPITIETLIIAARDPNGKNVDFPADINVTISANSTYTYSKTKVFNEPGNYNFFSSSIKDGYWNNSYPKSSSSSITRSGGFIVQNNLLVTSGALLSSLNSFVGDTVTATMDIKNYSDKSITIDTVIIAARDQNGKNVDFPADTNVTISANSTYKYSKSKVFNNPGNYTFFISGIKNGYWNNSYPESDINSSITRSGSFVIKDK